MNGVTGVLTQPCLERGRRGVVEGGVRSGLLRGMGRLSNSCREFSCPLFASRLDHCQDLYFTLCFTPEEVGSDLKCEQNHDP